MSSARTLGRPWVRVFAGGKTGLVTGVNLVELGDDVDMNDISVVVHINSRGNFALTQCRKPRVPYTP
ncbi:hypothetical protein FIBSPDRAFT_963703 [Athelia psychrophila]|uniref:Uncharacterized protein n=1 Tax=Athelia psychrophila TaxID=1759441 RepID=A0A165YNQ4_9AGAM|nr:hypothetical protein FIBSPDRAFT_963703 [Fibularhizoctonia sp. CBS 109695]